MQDQLKVEQRALLDAQLRAQGKEPDSGIGVLPKSALKSRRAKADIDEGATLSGGHPRSILPTFEPINIRSDNARGGANGLGAFEGGNGFFGPVATSPEPSVRMGNKRGFGKAISEITRTTNETEDARKMAQRDQLTADLQEQMREREGKKLIEKLKQWDEDFLELKSQNLPIGKPRPEIPADILQYVRRAAPGLIAGSRFTNAMFDGAPGAGRGVEPQSDALPRGRIGAGPSVGVAAALRSPEQHHGDNDDAELPAVGRLQANGYPASPQPMVMRFDAGSGSSPVVTMGGPRVPSHQQQQQGPTSGISAIAGLNAGPGAGKRVSRFGVIDGGPDVVGSIAASAAASQLAHVEAKLDHILKSVAPHVAAQFGIDSYGGNSRGGGGVDGDDGGGYVPSSARTGGGGGASDSDLASIMKELLLEQRQLRQALENTTGAGAGRRGRLAAISSEHDDDDDDGLDEIDVDGGGNRFNNQRARGRSSAPAAGRRAGKQGPASAATEGSAGPAHGRRAANGASSAGPGGRSGATSAGARRGSGFAPNDDAAIDQYNDGGGGRGRQGAGRSKSAARAAGRGAAAPAYDDGVDDDGVPHPSSSAAPGGVQQVKRPAFGRHDEGTMTAAERRAKGEARAREAAERRAAALEAFKQERQAAIEAQKREKAEQKMLKKQLPFNRQAVIAAQSPRQEQYDDGGDGRGYYDDYDGDEGEQGVPAFASMSPLQQRQQKQMMQQRAVQGGKRPGAAAAAAAAGRMVAVSPIHDDYDDRPLPTLQHKGQKGGAAGAGASGASGGGVRRPAAVRAGGLKKPQSRQNTPPMQQHQRQPDRAADGFEHATAIAHVRQVAQQRRRASLALQQNNDDGPSGDGDGYYQNEQPLDSIDMTVGIGTVSPPKLRGAGGGRGRHLPGHLVHREWQGGYELEAQADDPPVPSRTGSARASSQAQEQQLHHGVSDLAMLQEVSELNAESRLIFPEGVAAAEGNAGNGGAANNAGGGARARGPKPGTMTSVSIPHAIAGKPAVVAASSDRGVAGGGLHDAASFGQAQDPGARRARKATVKTGIATRRGSVIAASGSHGVAGAGRLPGANSVMAMAATRRPSLIGMTPHPGLADALDSFVAAPPRSSSSRDGVSSSKRAVSAGGGGGSKPGSKQQQRPAASGAAAGGGSIMGLLGKVGIGL